LLTGLELSSDCAVNFSVSRAASVMTTFECEVCFETCTTRLELSTLKTGNGDILRAADCGHSICIECMARHVTVRVEEHKVFGISCPHPGCKNLVYELDLKRLVEHNAVPPEVKDKFAELRARDYSERLQEFSQTAQTEIDDLCLLQMLRRTARLCPRCHVIIERSAGCNSFYCICGHHFDYASAPRVIGDGIKNYDKVIKMAQEFGMKLNTAESYQGDERVYFRAVKTAGLLGITIEDAKDLNLNARQGDEEARSRIRSARQAKS